ncbi:MAG TPA: hypothetical protein VLB73_00820 [Patescibacteria group bacterium]|nr:hypothetical protein [Patescibacteria group bacterium]
MAKTKKTVVEADNMQQVVATLRAEIAKMAMQLSKMQLKNTTSLRTKKDELARLLTKMNMQKDVQKTEKSVRQVQDGKEETK